MPTRQQLLQSMREDALIANTCAMEQSGCNEFALRLANALTADLVNYIYDVAHRNDVRFQHDKSYRTVVITGCAFTSHLVSTIIAHHARPRNQQRKPMVVMLSPPHATSIEFDALNNKVDRHLAALRADGYECHKLFFGFHGGEHNIGMPEILPPHLANTIPYGPPEATIGVLSLHKLDLADKRLTDFAERFLEQLAIKAQQRRISQRTPTQWIATTTPPLCYLIAHDCTNHQRLIEKAERHGIKLVFSERLEQRVFIGLLKTIRNRGGLVGCDGLMTALQCIQLQVPFRMLQAWAVNLHFCVDLARSVGPLDEVAATMLGLNFNLADNKTVLDHEQATMSAMGNNVQMMQQRYTELSRPTAASDNPVLPLRTNQAAVTANIGETLGGRENSLASTVIINSQHFGNSQSSSNSQMQAETERGGSRRSRSANSHTVIHRHSAPRP